MKPVNVMAVWRRFFVTYIYLNAAALHKSWKSIKVASCAPNHQMTHLRGLKFLMHSEKLLAMASLLQELGLSVMVDTDPCNSLLALIMSKCLWSREFFWQEGHTTFATKYEADAEILDVIDHSCAPNHQMTHLRGLKFLMHSEKLLAMASLLQELGLSVMVDTDPCNSLLALIMSKCLLSYQVCGFNFLHFDARFENRPSHFNIPKSNVTEPGHWICNLSLNRHLKAVHFEVSSIMSTYLVAVVMGLFDRVEDKTSDGIVVCAYCPVRKSDKGKFAPSIAVKALDIFRNSLLSC